MESAYLNTTATADKKPLVLQIPTDWLFQGLSSFQRTAVLEANISEEEDFNRAEITVRGYQPVLVWRIHLHYGRAGEPLAVPTSRYPYRRPQNASRSGVQTSFASRQRHRRRDSGVVE